MTRRFRYRDQAWVLSGQLGGKALRLIGFMALARWLSPTEFGVWMLYLTAFTLAEMARTGFVRQALVKLDAESEAHARPALHGAAWVLTLVLTGSTCLLVVGLGLLFPAAIEAHGLEPFVTMYPLAALLSMPTALGQWIRHAQRDFRALTLLDTGQAVLFYGTILLWPSEMNIPLVTSLHAASYGVMSAVTLLLGWAHVRALWSVSLPMLHRLVAFGRHSVVTLVTTNLLKSTDDLVITSFLGPAAVAFYNVPFKVREVADIPLRTFGLTAYPKMATRAAQARYDALSTLLHRHVGALTLVLLPALAVGFVWAETWVVLLGGPNYASAAPILRCLLFAMALMPLDRYLGLVLDSLGRPQHNARKVMLMTAINLAGNLLVLSLSPTLWHVASVTVVGLLAGIAYGVHSLPPALALSPRRMVRTGFSALVEVSPFASSMHARLSSTARLSVRATPRSID